MDFEVTDANGPPLDPDLPSKPHPGWDDQSGDPDSGPAIERGDANDAFLAMLADVQMPVFRCRHRADTYPVRSRSLIGAAKDPKHGQCGWGDLRTLVEKDDAEAIAENNQSELSRGRVWAAVTDGRLAVIDVDGDTYDGVAKSGAPESGPWQSKVAFVEAELEARGITVYAKVTSPNKRGGAHLYVEGHPDVRNKVGSTPNNALWTGVDVRGKGGMIYLPGSRRAKPGHEGRTYEIEYNHLADISGQPCDDKARQSLVDLYHEVYGARARSVTSAPTLSVTEIAKLTEHVGDPRQVKADIPRETVAGRELRDAWIMTDLDQLRAAPHGARNRAAGRAGYMLGHWVGKTGLDPRWAMEAMASIIKHHWTGSDHKHHIDSASRALADGTQFSRPWPSARKAKSNKTPKRPNSAPSRREVHEALGAQGQAETNTTPDIDYADPVALADLKPTDVDWDRVPGGRAAWIGLWDEDSQQAADHWFEHRGSDWMRVNDAWLRWDPVTCIWDRADPEAIWEDVKSHVNIWCQLARLAKAEGLPDAMSLVPFRQDTRKHRQICEWVEKDSRLRRDPWMLDRHGHLFAFRDGRTWDGRACVLRESRRQDYLTRLVDLPAPDVEHRHPDADAILRMWGPADSYLHRWVQARWAKSLEAEYIADQRLMVVHGPQGDDGKSMFRDQWTRATRRRSGRNDFMGPLPIEMLTHDKDSVQRLNAMATIQRHCVLTTEELKRAVRFDEASVKDTMTRGEQAAMAKYRDRTTFDPVYAPIIFTNGLPTIQGTPTGPFWKRICVVPTQARFVDTDDPASLAENEFAMDDELAARIEADAESVYQALWAWAMRGHVTLKEHGGSLLRTKYPWPAEVETATAAWRAQYDGSLHGFYSLWIDFDDPDDEVLQRRPSRSTHAEVMKAIVRWTGEETGKGAKGEEYAWSHDRVKDRMLADEYLADRGVEWAKGRVTGTKNPLWCWKGITVRERPAVLNPLDIELDGDNPERPGDDF